MVETAAGQWSSIRASVWVLWIKGGGAAPEQKVRVCVLLLTLPFLQLPVLIVSHPISSPFPLLFLGQTGNPQPDLDYLTLEIVQVFRIQRKAE